VSTGLLSVARSEPGDRIGSRKTAATRGVTLAVEGGKEDAMAESPFEPGDPAPTFALPDQDGNEVSLADYAGRWVVLYFYPRDDTPGCTTEACEFTDGIQAFEDLDASVLGCSPDSPESHRKFIAKFKLKMTLLSDPGHEVMVRYGAWGTKTSYGKPTVGVIRSTVIIDPRSRVARHWPAVKAAGHADAVRVALAELRGT
jgi:thioredoxin-dependent peroxiredoxin